MSSRLPYSLPRRENSLGQQHQVALPLPDPQGDGAVLPVGPKAAKVQFHPLSVPAPVLVAKLHPVQGDRIIQIIKGKGYSVQKGKHRLNRLAVVIKVQKAVLPGQVGGPGRKKVPAAIDPDAPLQGRRQAVKVPEVPLQVPGQGKALPVVPAKSGLRCLYKDLKGLLPQGHRDQSVGIHNGVKTGLEGAHFYLQDLGCAAVGLPKVGLGSIGSQLFHLFYLLPVLGAAGKKRRPQHRCQHRPKKFSPHPFPPPDFYYTTSAANFKSTGSSPGTFWRCKGTGCRKL